MIATVEPQNTLLLDHLLAEPGGITRMEAVGLYRIYNLTARIAELRQRGFDIDTKIKHDHTGRRYARYFLRSTPTVRRMRIKRR